MKINYVTSNQKISVEIEGETQRAIFESLATFQEIFDEKECGKCKSSDFQFVVREVDGNKFYELRCRDCRARLNFGCVKDNKSLFPKRKDENGNWRGDNGWVRWNPEKKCEE